MKIAEALIQMKDLKGKLAHLAEQFQDDCQFRAIDESISAPETDSVMVEYLNVSHNLADLKTRIAKTNSKSGLSSKIHEMESLRSFISFFERFGKLKQQSADLQHIGYGDEVKSIITIATFSVEDLNLKLEASRKRIRDLDLELQRLNWVVDLENSDLLQE